jgi:hypothetical protein
VALIEKIYQRPIGAVAIRDDHRSAPPPSTVPDATIKVARKGLVREYAIPGKMSST